MTNNIDLALPIIDDAFRRVLVPSLFFFVPDRRDDGFAASFRVTDVEAVAMSRYLVHRDGLFLGSSSACNLVACVKWVKQMGWQEGQTVVTIL